jgi:hypothetical protein
MHARQANFIIFLAIIVAFLLTGTAVSGVIETPRQELVYGSGIAADALGNLEVTNRNISYRFKAEHTGTIDKIVFYLVFRPGGTYYNGTGGKLLVELQTDDGTEQHNPSGRVLGSRLIERPMNVTNHDYEGKFVVGWGGDPDVPRGSYPVINLTPPPQLEEGKLYHIVFSNPDPEPTTNWVSVNNLHVHCESDNPDMQPTQPRFSDEELDFLWTNAIKQWTHGCLSPKYPNKYTPAYSLYFTDGYSQGHAYIATLIEFPASISGNNMVKEKFTVSGNNRTVTAVSVRLAKSESYPHPEDLTFKLEEKGGPTIEEGTVPASSGALLIPNWITYNFSKPHVLESGKNYSLILSAPAGDPYIIYPIEDGCWINFTGAFKDGWAQYSKNSGTSWAGFGWPGSSGWGDNPTNPWDLQFYFSVEPCGDGIKGGLEECDGTDLGGKTCASLGYGGGTPSCYSNCTINTQGCIRCRTGADGIITQECNGDVETGELEAYISEWYKCSSCIPDLYQAIEAYFTPLPM